MAAQTSLLDSWIKSGANAKFGIRPQSPSIECMVNTYHNGNYVSATEHDSTAQEAFKKAVAKIELTIGSSWRSSVG